MQRTTITNKNRVQFPIEYQNKTQLYNRKRLVDDKFILKIYLLRTKRSAMNLKLCFRCLRNTAYYAFISVCVGAVHDIPLN